MKILISFIIVTLTMHLFNNRNSTEENQISLEGLLTNTENKLQLEIGEASSLKESFTLYKVMSREEILAMVEKEELNLYEAGNALLILAVTYLNEGDVIEGVRVLEASAFIYHNPLAQVTLAKAHFRGVSTNLEVAPERDLATSWYLINRSFETCKWIFDATGEKWILDKCVAIGLALMDTFELEEIRKEYNHRDHLTEIKSLVRKDKEQFLTLYRLSI